MCVDPLYIPTQSQKIYKNMRHRIVNTIPCGKCWECRKDKVQSLMVRGYYEMMDSKFCIFDTLTYSEKCVPTCNGVRILNYSDFQKFMKRLRKDIDIEFTYIVSGEYGTKEECTHRPHYHFIIFVKENCNPIDISIAISDNWHYGITDGVRDKGLYYFNTQRLFNGMQATKNVVGYICKYMNKIAKYDHIIETVGIKKFNDLKTEFYQDDKMLRKVLRQHKQFVKWSKGFGKSFLENKDAIFEYENNMYITLPTDLKFKKYKLPEYYRKKLYYEIDPETDNYRLNYQGWLLKQKMNKYIVKSISDKIIANYDIFDDSTKIEIDKIGVNKIADYAVNYRGYLLNSKNDFDYITYMYLANTKNDRYTFENGMLIDDGQIMSAKEYFEKNVIADSMLDGLLDKINNYLNSIGKIKAESEERIRDIKNFQKFDL